MVRPRPQSVMKVAALVEASATAQRLKEAGSSEHWFRLSSNVWMSMAKGRGRMGDGRWKTR